MNQQLVLNCVLCFLVGFFLHSILKHGPCGKHVVEGAQVMSTCKDYKDGGFKCLGTSNYLVRKNQDTLDDRYAFQDVCCDQLR